MPHATQSSLYLSLRQIADITGPIAWTSAATGPVAYDTSRRATRILAAQADLPNGMFLVPSGVSLIDGVFVPGTDWYVEGAADFDLWYRGRLAGGDVVYAGTAADPDFTARGKTMLIYNNNSATIYFRRGTPNAYGDVIASPADVVSDSTRANVVGVPIVAGASAMLWEELDYNQGDPIYLLGSASSQKATVVLGGALP